MAHCYLGCDPGAKGALALFDPTTGNLDIFDMPVHIIKVGKTKKARIDLYELGRFVDFRKEWIKIAAIESVHAMPAQGVSSSFNFGFAAGALEGIIAANFIPMERVTPQRWKKAMGLTADKDACRRRASELMPRHADKWSRKMDDGRAEAALIAKWLAVHHAQ